MKTKIVNYIPYQTCPVCSGSGTIRKDSINTTCLTICNICKGAKIIPMHEIKDSVIISYPDYYIKNNKGEFTNAT